MLIKEIVKQVLSDNLDVSVDELADEARFSDFADDLDTVDVVVALEKVFNISLPDEEDFSWVTIIDIVDCVRYKVQSAGGVKDYDAVLSKINNLFGVSISRKVAGNFKSFQALVNYIYNARA
ncbi:phosphopantetheine-binding protein [Pseudomonas cichorii]|uniref:phosphopantetheine-binding protein n=1 Tax=Pseudomonas cichorii TaxID=36746 RepID=UPI001C887B00|nr:phosphopantetheine-binding protein [Pseudomonas cichorii]MBX8484847.1 hypothetical protein [Pseudomonas cichorii]MBX8597674.1 hypothetical protein [Pseudomonas cichorii]MBX8618000.1 hypothetical protein [Pseudomonas cichorii]